MNAQIDGGTRTVGLIGQPVTASRSPAMHNAAFAALGLDWRYLAFDVDPDAVSAAIHGAVALRLVGLNVTAPHKAAAARVVDRVDGMAALLGLVNTVVIDDSHAVGYSTDGAGFVDAARDAGVDAVDGMRVVVLGAGGAGASVAAALDAAGADVTLINRDPARLERALAMLAAARLASGKGDVARAAARGHRPGSEEAVASLADADLVVNTIPPAVAPPPGIGATLRADAMVCDLAYEPATPPFLAATAGARRRQWNGLGMLLHQGARSQRLWTGRPPPVAVMAEAIGYRLARARG